MTDDLVSSLIDELHEDPYQVSVPLLWERTQAVGRSRANLMLATLQAELERHPHVPDERARVSLVKTLVALLPSSLSAVNQLLRLDDGRESHELHFTLFCFLGDHPLLERDPRLRAQILFSVVSYLTRTTSSEAQAAWMAGDLLGDHWRPDEAVPELTDLALGRAQPAGRLAAVHGLSQAAERVGPRGRWGIHETLQEVVRRDGDEVVRQAARDALDRLAEL